MRLFLITSLLFHALIFLVLHGSPPRPSRPTEIELITVEKKTTASGRRKGRGRGRGLKLSPSLPLANTPSEGESSVMTGLLNEDWGSGGGRFGEIENFLSYEKLQAQIRGALHYPSILGRREIEGTVNVRLKFQNGQCDWKSTNVQSGSRPLAIYVIALLKKICGMDAIHTVSTAGNSIDLSFNFSLSHGAHSETEEQARDFVVGNVLSFRRTYSKSLLEYQIGPIRGVWFVPAVSLDIPWIVEKWDYYVNGADPMAPFKE